MSLEKNRLYFEILDCKFFALSHPYKRSCGMSLCSEPLGPYCVFLRYWILILMGPMSRVNKQRLVFVIVAHLHLRTKSRSEHSK